MIKKTLIAFGVLVSLILIVIIGFIIALQTRFATPILNKTLPLLSIDATVKHVKYQFPNHLHLQHILFKPAPSLSTKATKSTQPIQINSIEIWLNGINWRTHKVVLQDLLIDGLQLTPTLATAYLPKFKTHHLALKNISIDEPNLMAQDLNIQISDPKWQPKTSFFTLPYGEIQLSAKQIKWHEQVFNHLLINSNYQARNSTIKGISFDWQTSHISGQAEQYDQKWSLVNVTLDKLNLTQQQIDQFSDFVARNKAQWQLNHINSLDITNSDIPIGNSHFYGLNLSIEDMDITQWPPKQGTVTLEANSLKWHELQFIEPIADIELTPTHIKLKQLSTEFMQGQIQTSADITSDKLNINNLSLNGIKWIVDKAFNITTFSDFFINFNDISLQKLKVMNSQIIQANNTPRWQSSGTYINGSQLIVKQGGRWNLWQGNLKITANNMSIGDVMTNQAIVDMQTKQGIWQLKRAFLPLEQGYIKASAQMDFNRISRPWSLTLNTDSLPIASLLKPFALPFTLTGMTDIDATLSGLGGDSTMFNSTLTGLIHANLHSLKFKQPNNVEPLNNPAQEVRPNTNTPSTTPVTSPLIHSQLSDSTATLTADRGRITLSPLQVQGEDQQILLQGKWDMMTSSRPDWQLNYQTENSTTKIDLFQSSRGD